MNSFYIYGFNYHSEKKDKNGDSIFKNNSCTVIFCPNSDINRNNLKEEIRNYFESHYQTSKIFIIGGNDISEKLINIFDTDQDDTFRGVPKREETALRKSIYILSFDLNGEIKSLTSKIIPDEFKEVFRNEGLQNVFIKRGGLVESSGSHHFVFPSGKHCDKFLRPGNILLVSSEINFIAFTILKHFDHNLHDHIFCDTSSINSVGFALISLKSRFIENNLNHSVPISSFSSYEGLYDNKNNYKRNHLILISASTSSNIVNYIKNLHSLLTQSNIVVLYFLGEDVKYRNISDQVLCNLTKSETNFNGIKAYRTYKDENCEFCKSGSYPVEISGDSFSLNKPKINRIVLKRTDADKKLSSFVKQFMSIEKGESILKANYKEKGKKGSYEIYLDYEKIIAGLNEGKRFSSYKSKLNSFIDQYVPSNVKYIIHLNDNGSSLLTELIWSRISGSITANKTDVIINQDQLESIENKDGAVMVVASCISNGKNLLFISRTLRKYEKLKILYFVGISRTETPEYLKFLKSNLQQGGYGPNTNSFICVENINCSNEYSNNPWTIELEFLNGLIDYVSNAHDEKVDVINLIKERKKILLTSQSSDNKGLNENLFYPRLQDSKHIELRLRKNFAFFNFSNYVDDVSQSDVYYTISNIINGLRNSTDESRSLRQSPYVRNILDPGNFHRFNDGIIQACLLRSAKPSELAYHLNVDASNEMLQVLETIVLHSENEQGEALFEFVYAVAIDKLTLVKSDMEEFLNLILAQCNGDLYIVFIEYIRYLIAEKIKLREVNVSAIA